MEARRMRGLWAVFAVLTVAGVGYGQEPLPKTGRYILDPEVSIIAQSGGYAGVNWTFELQGQFCLIVDPETGSAHFEQIEITAAREDVPTIVVDPNELIDLNNLVGTVNDDGVIEFTGQTPDGSSIGLTATWDHEALHLLGQTTPPPGSADFFLFTLDATAQLKYDGGTGEPNNPYQIATASQMNAIGTEPNDWDKHFQLTASIDLGIYEGSEFNIIAPDPCTPFRGTFDGAGHTISNLTYFAEEADYAGLFGVVDDPNAWMRNVTLTRPHIEVQSSLRVGALVGHLEAGTVIHCHAHDAVVQAVGIVGGLIGSTGLASGLDMPTIMSCSCEGDVLGGEPNYAALQAMPGTGGLLGGGYTAEIYQCFAGGTITGRMRTGGLLGGCMFSTVANCYSTCTVTGTSGVGGLIGDGLFVSQCYAAGTVTGDSNVGGLIGFTLPIDLIGDSFWGGEVSGQIRNSAGLHRTTAQMQDPQTFIHAGWDFLGPDDGPSDMWAQPDGGGYPILWWQVSELPALNVAGGTGTQDDPYLIATAEQLNSIGYNPRLVDAHFLMTGDIDLEGVESHPIGSTIYPFAGVFDGGGFSISNFTYDTITDDGVGLFREVDGHTRLAHVRNLGLIDPNVQGRYDVGSLVSHLARGTLRNCYVQGGQVTGGGRFTGGLVGWSGWQVEDVPEGQSNIIGCYTSTNVSGSASVGGLVGAQMRGGTITDCWTDGMTVGNGEVGGLAGHNDFSTINRSFSLGSVAGSWQTGGLVGSNAGAIRDCYAIAAVSGTEMTGGLVGLNEDRTVSPMYSPPVPTIDNCYAAGKVTGSTATGGLVGRVDRGRAWHCFWDVQTSGQSTSTGGKGLTTAYMQAAETYLEVGWDFVDETDNGVDDIWWIDEGQDYPRLGWELE